MNQKGWWRRPRKLKCLVAFSIGSIWKGVTGAIWGRILEPLWKLLNCLCVGKTDICAGSMPKNKTDNVSHEQIVMMIAPTKFFQDLIAKGS